MRDDAVKPSWLPRRLGSDAALKTQGAVRVEWQCAGDTLELRVLDKGRGIAHSVNLFVPFYTTNADGTGIGLVLSRQIRRSARRYAHAAQSHRCAGAEARLTLPIGSAPTSLAEHAARASAAR
jgi:signal transduction histidine kinase